MSLTISCPSCQRPLRVPENLLGQSVKCPSCGQIFTAPDHLEEPAPSRLAPEQPSRRSSPPPREDEVHEEPLPSRLAARYDDEDDDAPRRRYGGEKPGKVQAIAIMVLVGGILACVGGAGWTLLSGFGCCLWPGLYYSIVMGIMAIVKGAELLGEKAHRAGPPKGIAVMMIINIINMDMVNLTLGILVLVFLADEEVKDYFRR